MRKKGVLDHDPPRKPDPEDLRMQSYFGTWFLHGHFWSHVHVWVNLRNKILPRSGQILFMIGMAFAILVSARSSNHEPNQEADRDPKQLSERDSLLCEQAHCRSFVKSKSVAQRLAVPRWSPGGVTHCSGTHARPSTTKTSSTPWVRKETLFRRFFGHAWVPKIFRVIPPRGCSPYVLLRWMRIGRTPRAHEQGLGSETEVQNFKLCVCLLYLGKQGTGNQHVPLVSMSQTRSSQLLVCKVGASGGETTSRLNVVD